MLNRKEILNNDNLKKLKEECEHFVKNENYKIIKKDLLNKLYIDDIKIVFSYGIMFNGSENDLLQLLIDYYKCSIDDERLKEEMKLMIEKCNFSMESMNGLSDEDKELLSLLNISNNVNENERYSINSRSRKYLCL